MTRVKICGLTRPEDVDLACTLGASYVGFVFASASSRRVSLDGAPELAAAARPGVARVGVFVGEDYGLIAEAVEAAALDLAQIHRPLRSEDLESIRIPVLTVARVTAGAVSIPSSGVLARCRAILFDSGAVESGGGSGTRFDWSLLAGQALALPVFLAGGLTAQNVGEAIARVRPAAVDVASGVESVPGRKDPAKMRRFFEAVRQADARPTFEPSPSPAGRGSG